MLNAQPRLLDALQQQIVPLAQVEPTADTAELRPFRSALAGVRVWGLGEATHGTHEFFTLKHRLIQWGITSLGYRYIAFEAPFDRLCAVNQYLQGQQLGSARKATQQMAYWPWMTTEVQALLQWLHDYNAQQTPQNRVQVIGIDRQSMGSAHFWAEQLRAFAPDVADQWEKDLTEIGETPFYLWDDLPAETKQRHRQTVLALQAYLEPSKSPIRQHFTVEEWRTAQFHLRVLHQSLSAPSPESGRVTDFRDSCMAANVVWWTQQVDRRENFFFWGHNGHVSMQVLKGKKGKTYRRAGAYLHQSLGTAYYSLGFDFGQGSFRSADPDGVRMTMQVPAEFPRKAACRVWADLKEPLFFWDFRQSAQHKDAQAWLRKTHLLKQIGAGYDSTLAKLYFRPVKLRETFDGILYVDQTTASIPLLNLRPGFTLNVDPERFPDQSFRFSCRVKMPDSACQKESPRFRLSYWTSRSTLGEVTLQVESQDTAGWWTVQLTDRFPLETTIIHLSMAVDCPSFWVDELRFEQRKEEVWRPVLEWNAAQDASPPLRLRDNTGLKRRAKATRKGANGYEIFLLKEA